MSDNLLLTRLKELENIVAEYRKQEIPGADTGWIADTAAWTYASATTLTITGDVTARFPVGTKVKLTQTTVKYFYVVSATYSAPNTTITLTGGSDYSLANAAITSPYYSYSSTPQGFPQAFNYAVTWANITVGAGTSSGKFIIIGRELFYRASFVLGTGSSIDGDVNYLLPCNAVSTGVHNVKITDAGTNTFSAYGDIATNISHVRVINSSGTYATYNVISATVPMTWATGDSIVATGNYEI